MEDNQSKKSTKSNVLLYLSLILVGGTVACCFFVPAVQNFLDKAWQVLTSNDETRIKEWVAGFGWYGPLVLIVVMIAQMFLLVIPTIAIMVVSILAYGPLWGSIIILAAVFAASSVGYFLGRYLGKTVVMKLLGQKTKHKIEQFIGSYGFWAIIVTRLNPFLSNDAISFVGGTLKMGYWKFIGATMMGILPLTAFIAILGKSTEQLKTGLMWGSLVSLAGFGCYVWWDKTRNK